MCGGMRTSLKFLENVDGFYTTVTDTPNRIPAKMSIPKIDHFRFLCRQPNLGFWSGEKTTTPENVNDLKKTEFCPGNGNDPRNSWQRLLGAVF